MLREDPKSETEAAPDSLAAPWFWGDTEALSLTPDTPSEDESLLAPRWCTAGPCWILPVGGSPAGGRPWPDTCLLTGAGALGGVLLRLRKVPLARLARVAPRLLSPALSALGVPDTPSSLERGPDLARCEWLLLSTGRLASAPLPMPPFPPLTGLKLRVLITSSWPAPGESPAPEAFPLESFSLALSAPCPARMLHRELLLPVRLRLWRSALALGLDPAPDPDPEPDADTDPEPDRAASEREEVLVGQGRRKRPATCAATVRPGADAATVPRSGAAAVGLRGGTVGDVRVCGAAPAAGPPPIPKIPKTPPTEGFAKSGSEGERRKEEAEPSVEGLSWISTDAFLECLPLGPAPGTPTLEEAPTPPPFDPSLPPRGNAASPRPASLLPPCPASLLVTLSSPPPPLAAQLDFADPGSRRSKAFQERPLEHPGQPWQLSVGQSTGALAAVSPRPPEGGLRRGCKRSCFMVRGVDGWLPRGDMESWDTAGDMRPDECARGVPGDTDERPWDRPVPGP